MDGIILSRKIKDKRDEIYTYLHNPVPETVRNGYVQKAVEFKSWCEDAQHMLKKALPANERTLSDLEYLASRYRQFTGGRESRDNGEPHNDT